MSFLDLLVSPSVLVGTVIGATLAVGISRLFPEHDLAFLQLLVAVSGLLTGVVFDLVGKSRGDK